MRNRNMNEEIKL